MAPDTTARGPEVPHARVFIDDEGSDAHPLECMPQAPQPFLVRSSWTKLGAGAANQDALKRAIDYRTEKYGHFAGFGDPNLNRFPPAHYAESMTLLGQRIQVHSAIVPALKCVEAALRATHLDAVYHPRSMGGMRFKNTYRGAEISNHVFGIAIDIEPSLNTCCSCVAPWSEHPLCKKAVSSIYQRMAMPRSWVIVFERYGFYWLGHDALQDTMHFEFLGDPDRITKPSHAHAPSPAASSNTTLNVATTKRSTPGRGADDADSGALDSGL
jgi:D-alanyl-D-alanine carboxypeptidase